MEASMYQAISEMKSSGKLHPLVNRNEGEKRRWRNRFKHFTLTETKSLVWNQLQVPTVEQLWATLQPIHVKNGKHLRDERVLREALVSKGFGLPPFIGGITRAVTTCVNLN